MKRNLKQGLERWAKRGALLAAILLSQAAAAQNYPTAPVRMIVPYAAGGGIDAIARLVGQSMGKALGQTIVIENRGGAGGMIGAEAAVQAKADGYTLLLAGNPELTVNPILSPSARYDVTRDLIPIMLISESPNVIAAHPSVNGTLKEILSTTNADKAVSVGTPGTGSTHHLAVEILKSLTGAELIHVPYKGAGPAVSDALGGQISLVVAGLPPLVPHMKAGKLRGLAVTQERRTALAPDIPTVAEVLGPDGASVVATTWYGILAPAGTPPDVVRVIQSTVAKVLDDPEIKDKLAAMGTDVAAIPGDAFGARIATELERNREVIKRYGIKAQ